LLSNRKNIFRIQYSVLLVMMIIVMLYLKVFDFLTNILFMYNHDHLAVSIIL